MANKCFSGLHLAIVVKVGGDKDKLNQVKTKLVSEGDHGIELDYAPVLTNSAGKNYGIVSLPKKDDFVIVAFLDNDIQRPVILGSVPTPTKKPPIQVDGDNNNTIRTHKTADGLELTIDEKKDASKITIKTKSENVFTWDDKANSISFKSKDGKTAISIDIKNSKIKMKAQTISINAEQSIEIKGGEKIKLSNKSGLKVDSAGGSLDVNVSNIKLKSSGVANIKAASANIQAKGGAKLQATGVTQVKGATVMIG